VLHLRRADEAPDMTRLTAICHLIGPQMARPLAEALAVEEHPRAIKDLRELLLSFGAAGRQSVEQLKNSSNPAVRRTAIDLLRVFGGREALAELASMLDDADSQVQRESIRAIVQIGTNEAYAVLERALVAGSASRDNLVQQLIGLRDQKAVPLLCYVLDHTRPRGRLVQVHLEIVDALGGLGPHRETARTLKAALYRGEWWAPRRTTALRRAAAAALRRIASPEAMAVLNEAAAEGGRGVRSAVQGYAGAAPRGDRSVRLQPDREKHP
jgi:HEAT repeat protein